MLQHPPSTRSLVILQPAGIDRIHISRDVHRAGRAALPAIGDGPGGKHCPLSRQPADASNTGDDSDSAGLKEDIDINKLSYEDVASLPAATLKRMRGDVPA